MVRLPVRSHTNHFMSLQVALILVSWKYDDILHCGVRRHSPDWIEVNNSFFDRQIFCPGLITSRAKSGHSRFKLLNKITSILSLMLKFIY